MCQKGENMSSIYSNEQMNQLGKKFEGAGFTSEEVTRLGQYENFSGIRGLFHGTHEIKQIRHLIDCDANPFVPYGFRVKWHHKGGKQLEWNTEKVKFYRGNNLRKELAGKLIPNANALDYLLENQDLIPKELKDENILFRGTGYYFSDQRFGVRFLYWCGAVWGSGLYLDTTRYSSSDNPTIFLDP